MPRGTLDFLEEPIRDESPEAYESLRTMTDVPFAIGEEMASKRKDAVKALADKKTALAKEEESGLVAGIVVKK